MARFMRNSKFGLTIHCAVNSLFVCLLIAGFSALSTASDSITSDSPKAAPKPLYRDPVHDGAADPALIWNRGAKKWMIFYTNRRADLPGSGKNDVRWVHGTQIGVTESADGGTTWTYVGTAKLPYGKADYTFWAPYLLCDRVLYHMYVVVVPGTFSNCYAPRDIVHFTSRDLTQWKFAAKLKLPSDRVIDPYILRLDNGAWRIWYKDERDHGLIHYADSPDLYKWTPVGEAINDRPSEGPIVFRWKNEIWLIVDAWDGLGVYRSTDALHWVRQKENLLAGAGRFPTDRSEGHHGDVVVSGGRAFLFYFVQLKGEDMKPGDPDSAHRSALQVVELDEQNGELRADRDKPTFVSLQPGS